MVFVRSPVIHQELPVSMEHRRLCPCRTLDEATSGARTSTKIRATSCTSSHPLCPQKIILGLVVAQPPCLLDKQKKWASALAIRFRCELNMGKL